MRMPIGSFGADGTSGIIGALAALTQYFASSPTITAQTDCGLDLGWTHPNATNSAKSINNTAVCLGAELKRPARLYMIASPQSRRVHALLTDPSAVMSRP